MKTGSVFSGISGSTSTIVLTDVSSSFSDWLYFVGVSLDWHFFVALGCIVVRLLIVLWVVRDVIARTNSVFFQVFSVLLVTFGTPLIGLPFYLVLRPISLKKDRLLWREALELQTTVCHNCKQLNLISHAVCTECGETLKIECKECHTDYSYHYHYCPECGAPNIE